MTFEDGSLVGFPEAFTKRFPVSDSGKILRRLRNVLLEVRGVIVARVSISKNSV